MPTPATSAASSDELGAVRLVAHSSPETCSVICDMMPSEGALWQGKGGVGERRREGEVVGGGVITCSVSSAPELRSRPAERWPSIAPEISTAPISGITTKEALQHATSCSESTDAAGTRRRSVSGEMTSYSATCGRLSVTTVSLCRVRWRAERRGCTTAFQPRAPPWSARRPSSSSVLAAAPSCPTSGRHASPCSVSVSVNSVGDSTDASRAVGSPPLPLTASPPPASPATSSVPPSATVPGAAATVAVSLTASIRPDVSAAGGILTVSRSGASMSYSGIGGSARLNTVAPGGSAHVALGVSVRSSPVSAGCTTASQPRGLGRPAPSPAERIPCSSCRVASG